MDKLDKLNMKSPDFTEQNIAKLAELFPNCVTEAKNDKGELQQSIDFDLLKQELSSNIVDGPRERYQLNWPGKREALLTANTPITKTLRPCREESVDFDTTENLFIEGDNLDALKLLQETYLGKVKMIYIDPPYNTGKDFIYSDNFTVDKDDYDLASEQKDEEGGRLVANTESNGRFHSDWLDMMYPRLKLARNLLRDDGVIFISIDDNEAPNLRKLCDEVFGEKNFIAKFVWAAGRKNDSKHVSVSHEYIVVYARSKEYLKENNVTWRLKKSGLEDIYKAFNKFKRLHGTDYKEITKELKNWFKNLPASAPAKRQKHYSHVDERGIYFPDNISWPGGGGPKYEVLHPSTGKPCKIPTRGWMFGQFEKMQKLIQDGRVHFGDDETSVPCIKSYLKDREEEVPYSVFYQDGRASTKRLRMLMGGDYFDHPKDELVLADLIEACTNNEDIIFDFFAGSGTIAHAVFLANNKQLVSRRFVLVQFPEKLDSSKATGKRKKLIERAITFLDSINKPHHIAEISKERIRRAGKKIKEELTTKHTNNTKEKTKELSSSETDDFCVASGSKDLDIGFRVLKVDSSNMKDVYYAPDAMTQGDLVDQTDNIKEDRSAEDLLFQVLLDWGVDLTLPIVREMITTKHTKNTKEKTKDFEVFFVDASEDNSALCACFEKDIYK